MKIPIPSTLHSDVEGFTFLNASFGALRDVACEDVVLDFRDTVTVDPNLCAAIGALVDDATERFNDVAIVNLDRNVEAVLRDSCFLAPLVSCSAPSTGRQMIKYRKSRVAKDVRVRSHLCDRLVQKSDLPALPDLLRRCVFEIYNNAIDHGGCDYIYSCGLESPAPCDVASAARLRVEARQSKKEW